MIVTIDGLIGCGKSTTLTYLETAASLRTVPEPVSDWQPYLNDLYNKVPGSAFRLQSKVWLDRCLGPPPPGVVYMERSPLFQWSCFVNGNLAPSDQKDPTHLITPTEKEILAQMYEHTGGLWRPSVYIYLRCSPAVAHRRIQERSGGKENISLEYIERLHQLHEETLLLARSHGLPIAVIDSDGGKSTADIAQEIVEAVDSFSDTVQYSDAAIPVPERLLYNTYQLLDWVANWNKEDDDYNPPPTLCRAMSDELQSIWRARGDRAADQT